MWWLLVLGALVAVGKSQKEYITRPPKPPAMVPPAGSYCSDTTCAVPKCHCAMSRPDIPLDQTPQMVFLTFDDAISSTNIDYYHEILSGRTNPNGCPITGTFFVSHAHTDYVEVNWLWRQGNEIASHTISHEPMISYWENGNYTLWQQEVAGMRDIISLFANIPHDQITGMRAPFLQMGGDEQFQMLFDEHFEYDCSWPTRIYVPEHNNRTKEQHHGLWPYTMDYASPQLSECNHLHDNCPRKRYPGLWEVPMLDLFDYLGNPCAMVDTCFLPPEGTIEDAVFNLLLDNFNRHYYNGAMDGPGLREPFGIYTHAAWFHRDIGIFYGYLKFLDYILEKDDVFIVSIQKGLEWIKQPTTLDKLAFFKPWQCEEKRMSSCRRFHCKYINSPVGHHAYMRSCIHCPPVYPWLGNTHGGEEDWDNWDNYY